MRLVKRAAITVTPKQPYIDWANGLDEDGVKIGEDFEPEKSVYLIGAVTDVIPFGSSPKTSVKVETWHRTKPLSCEPVMHWARRVPAPTRDVGDAAWRDPGR